MRVLVADDEEALLDTFERALTRAGHIPVTAGDGREALGLLEGGGPFEALITDMTMGAVSGLEVARRFRSLYPKGRICILTGELDSEKTHVREAAELGITFLEKPFKKGELIAWLEGPA